MQASITRSISCSCHSQIRGWITVIGDTLPNALMDKPNEYLDRLPTMIDNKGRPIMVPDMEIDMAAQNAVP